MKMTPGAALTRRSAFRNSSREMLVQCVLLDVGIAMILLSAFLACAAGSPGSIIQAELLHREHLSSPFRSPEHLTERARLYHEGQRSMGRAQMLIKRKTRRLRFGHKTLNNATLPQTNVTAWEATISNASPAEYLMTISLGTPAQKFVAVVDTGSDLTWLQCAPCTGCFRQEGPVFNPSRSSTFRNLSCATDACQLLIMQYGSDSVTSCSNGCQYKYTYGDGSNTTGTLSSETISLSTRKSQAKLPNFWFGCSHASYSGSALFDSSNGVVGLGQGRVSFPSQLAPNIGDVFSYCLVNRTSAKVRSSALVFGQGALDVVVASDASGTATRYTPILSNIIYPFFYYVSVEGISVDGAPLAFDSSVLAIDDVGRGGMIVDSGTTYTQLAPHAFDVLLTAVFERVPYPSLIDPDLPWLELCFNVTGVPRGYESRLPAISFRFANASSWDLRPHNSWISFPYDTHTQMLCLAITRAGNGEFSVFGNIQQQDFHVVYDRAGSRLGFKATDCGGPLR